MSLPCCFCVLHPSTGSLKMPTYTTQESLPRKIGMVLMLASFLNFAGSFCTITDFACFCILLCLLVQNNEWYTCPGVCKLIKFMNVDVAHFFFGVGVAFCLGVFNRKGNHRKSHPELDLSLNGHSWTGSPLSFLPPECFMLWWINGVILASKQGVWCCAWAPGLWWDLIHADNGANHFLCE